MKMQERASVIVLFSFVLALIHSIWALTVGWDHTLMDQHNFRQTQTALTAYFLGQGGPFFAYETPLLGPPWSIPFELPVYQWLVAKVHAITGWAWEPSGRAVGRAFFWFSLLPFYSILRSCDLRPFTRWAGLTLYLLSPLYLYWSRTFLIESTALFFSLSFLATLLLALANPRWHWLLLSAVGGALAGTTKSTTAFTFFLVGGLIFLWYLVDAWRQRGILWIYWIKQGFFLFGIPAIATVTWLAYTEKLRTENPLAGFIASNALSSWTFGTLEQRLSGDFWYMIFRKVIHDSIGHRTTWIASLLLLPLIPKPNRLGALGALGAFVLTPLVFTNLHIVHNYYWYANGIFLLAYLAFVLDGTLNSPHRLLPLLGLVLFLTAGALSARHYYRFFYFSQLQNEAAFGDLPANLAFVKPNEVVVVLGGDWYPVIPWATKQRMIMLRTEEPAGFPHLAQSLANLRAEGREVGAVIDCNPSRENSAQELASVRQHLSFPTTARYQGSCHVY